MKRELTFVDGLCVGIGAVLWLVLLWEIRQIEPIGNMYKNYGADLPGLTKLVLARWWHVVPPTLVVVLAGVAFARKSRPVMIALPIVALVLVVLTYVGLYAPLTELAGNIQ